VARQRDDQREALSASAFALARIQPPAYLVKFLRRHLMLTQREFSVLVGVQQETIGRWEKGFFRPLPRHVRKLHALLDTLQTKQSGRA
jgi:DNA-binding transcriptional regulator YiaG